MALTPEDLNAIKALLREELNSQFPDMLNKHLPGLFNTYLGPIQKDLAEIKKDTQLLAKLNQLDGIRSEPRLRRLYDEDAKQM